MALYRFCEPNDRMEFLFVDNILFISNKSEKHVIEYMKDRFLSQQYYTWVGPALIAVHPLHKFQEKNETDFSHINTLTDQIFFKMVQKIGKLKHTIIISGESGSGKTYTANLVVESLICQERKAKTDEQKDLLRKIHFALPLLETFGNARTIRNGNSSRFGMLLRLLCQNNEINGAHIHTYMLEKCRVSDPHASEGNFHIFQQVLEIDQEMLSSLYLDKNVNYHIVHSTNASTKTIENTLEGLKVFKINNIYEMFSILSIILNLGNIEFNQVGEHYEISKKCIPFVANASKLLKTDYDNIASLLTVRTIFCKSQGKRESQYSFPCENREECEARKKSVMRVLYEKLFLWIVKRINESMHVGEAPESIGILDFYGFEILNHNSLEQLCINYANERLHYNFVKDYLYDQISQDEKTKALEDYELRVQLLDGNPSIFGILNEESLLKRYNRDVFVNSRLNEELKDYPHLVVMKKSFTSTFAVKHYANSVRYEVRGMVTKNKDKVSKEVAVLIKQCEFEFAKELVFGDQMNETGTVLSKFKKSLDSLIKTLNDVDVHYIKCLKTNDCQNSNVFDEYFFIQQMRINGIFDIVKLATHKYPIRLSQAEFQGSYKENLLAVVKNFFPNDILENTMGVNVTEGCFTFLIKFQNVCKNSAAKVIQRVWRKKHRRRHEAATKIQKFFRKWNKHRRESYEHFFDISLKSGSTSLHKNEYNKNDRVTCDCLKHSSALRTQNYVNNLPEMINQECDQISLKLEEEFQNLETKTFSRNYFYSNNIVSRNRIAKIPIRMHLKRTCIPNSHLLPKSELSTGLTDIL